MTKYPEELFETLIELKEVMLSSFQQQSLKGPRQQLLDNGYTQDFIEGNAFYKHLSFELEPEYRSKQENLFRIGSFLQYFHSPEIRLCEIGFNAGHSLMLMLYGLQNCFQKTISCTVFDINEHSYTEPCFQYLQNKMKDANIPITFTFIEGDSTKTMKDFHSVFDIIHIDGGHSDHCIQNDLKNADRLSQVGSILIIDDTNLPYISHYVDLYLQTQKYEEIKTESYDSKAFHRIIRKVKE